MVIADLKKSTEQKMDKSVQAFKADLGKVRTGRAHTGILDHVMVDYYGTPTPINQVAKVTLIDSRNIGVTPFEKKMTQAHRATLEALLDRAGFAFAVSEFRRYGSARNLYNFHIDHAGSY